MRVIGSMDRRLRWVLFLPVGLGASLVFVGMVDAAFNGYYGNPRTFPGVFELSTLAFLACLTRTLFPAVISPKPWPVGIFLFVLDTVIRALPLYELMRYEYRRSEAGGAGIVVMAGVAGGCLALFLIRRVR